MNLTDHDIDLLKSSFPGLSYEPEAHKIIGELSFCACYDETTGKVRIEFRQPDDSIRNSDSFLCDVFEIEILLDTESLGPNGWPRVREVGGRYKAIAEKCGVQIIDLHFYSDTGACCLGIRHPRESNLTLKRFLFNLVLPFFYRLSYTDKFGIEAARKNLWGEYSHGIKGVMEYEMEMLNYTRGNSGRNKPCPCGSGVKYKKCCLNEAQAVVRESQLRHQKMLAR